MTTSQSGPRSLIDLIPIAAAMMKEQRVEDDNRVAKCANDVREFATHTMLNDPIRGPIPFEMWDWQPDLLQEWVDHRLTVVLKARQLGVSWLVAVYVLWCAMFRKSQRILLVSIGQDDADKLLSKVQFILDNLPDWLRPAPGLIRANTRTIRLLHLDSEIQSMPSTGTVGRSRTGSLVVLDEHAHQYNADAIYAAIKPTIERGQLISISTANGLGVLHTRLYKGAKDGRNGYHPVFVPWSAHPDRDEAWYEVEREAFRDTAQPQLFEQEYPADDVEAFVVSGNPVWTAEEISRQDVRTVEPTEPGLWVYREPEPGVKYVIGADPAEGIVGGDWCSASVMLVDRDEEGYFGEQVAQLRGFWPPELFAERLHALAQRYAVGYEPRKPKTCWLGVERNNHGHAVLLRLRQLNPQDTPYGLSYWKNAVGWVTNAQTRPLMYDEFAGAIRNEAVVVHDPVTVDQMSTFAQTKNGGEAQEGFHDDDMTALAIAWQHHRRAFGVVLDVPRRRKDAA